MSMKNGVQRHKLKIFFAPGTETSSKKGKL